MEIDDIFSSLNEEAVVYCFHRVRKGANVRAAELTHCNITIRRTSWTRYRVTAVVVVLLCLIHLAGCQRRGPRHVIVIMLDAARPDRFSCYGYPRLTTPEIDRLAAEGVVFHRHYAQATATRWSIPSMLYSRYFCAPIFPNSRHVPFSSPTALFRRPDDARISLPKAFERAGFKTAAISTHLWIGEDTPFAAEFTEANELVPGPDEEQVCPRPCRSRRGSRDPVGHRESRKTILPLHSSYGHPLPPFLRRRRATVFWNRSLPCPQI